MKNPMHSVMAMAALSAVALVSQGARAVDVEEGADGLFGQMQASQIVVMARLAKIDPSGKAHQFTLSRALQSGSVRMPLQFSVALPAVYGDSAELKAGMEYLIFLNSVGGRFEPAMSFYSFQPASSEHTSLYQAAVDQYARFKWDRRALKVAVKSMLNTRGALFSVPYLQYSLVSDLATYLAPDASDANQLGELLQSKLLSEPRARAISIQQIGRFKLANFAPVIEQVALDPNQSVGMKVHALDALVAMDAKPSLRRVLPVLEKMPSAKLKRHVGETLNPGRP